MLNRDIPLADHVVELLHRALSRIMHLDTGSVHEETVVGGMSFATTLWHRMDRSLTSFGSDPLKSDSDSLLLFSARIILTARAGLEGAGAVAAF